MSALFYTSKLILLVMKNTRKRNEPIVSSLIRKMILKGFLKNYNRNLTAIETERFDYLFNKFSNEYPN